MILLPVELLWIIIDDDFTVFIKIVQLCRDISRVLLSIPKPKMYLPCLIDGDPGKWTTFADMYMMNNNVRCEYLNANLGVARQHKRLGWLRQFSLYHNGISCIKMKLTYAEKYQVDNTTLSITAEFNCEREFEVNYGWYHVIIYRNGRQIHLLNDRYSHVYQSSSRDKLLESVPAELRSRIFPPIWDRNDVLAIMRRQDIYNATMRPIVQTPSIT